MNYKICPYCDNEAKLVDSSVLYGRSYGMIYLCVPCDAYVGTHKNSKDNKPLGFLANRELREARKAAHSVFDRLWQIHDWNRKELYQALADYLEIEVKRCHIAQFDIDTCRKVQEFVSAITEPQTEGTIINKNGEKQNE